MSDEDAADDLADDLAIMVEVQTRDAAYTGERMTLDELAAELRARDAA